MCDAHHRVIPLITDHNATCQNSRKVLPEQNWWNMASLAIALHQGETQGNKVAEWSEPVVIETMEPDR